MDINELTLGQLKEIAKITNTSNCNEEPLWEVGKQYFIRTVTMNLTGKLEAVTTQELKLSSAAWIADSGRFYDALLKGIDTLSSSEIEPFVNDVIVGRGALIDATVYDHELPKTQK